MFFFIGVHWRELERGHLPTVYLFLSRLFALTKHRDWIMLTDSPTGIVNVQPILEAIWLFLLGSCRRLANAAPSPSISSGFNPDIGSADICPRCPVPSVSCAREFREREDYISYAEHEPRYFVL